MFIRLFFLLVLSLLLFFKNIYFLSIMLILLLIFEGSLKIALKAFKAIFLFNLSISLGYVLLNFPNFDIDFLLYFNLRVYTLCYFVLLFFSKVDLIYFFSFSKELSYLLSITLSQIASYKKSFEDFKLAFKARSIKKTKDRDFQFIIRVFDYFFKKSIHSAKERSLAMKARGFFD